MAPQECRCGCFLITAATPRKWRHPDTDAQLDLAGLVEMLNEEAARIKELTGGELHLVAKGLDLISACLLKRKVLATTGNGLAASTRTLTGSRTFISFALVRPPAVASSVLAYYLE
jgi:hypothetical protein